MELVLDANVLVAGFLRSARTRELLLDERLRLRVPEYGLTETERVLRSPRIRKRLGDLSSPEINRLLDRLTVRIEVSPQSTYEPALAQAETLAPHPEDAPYLALALTLQIPLWSNDLELKKQTAVTVFTTEELLRVLSAR